MNSLIQASYCIAAALFILGLKQMSSPVTARRGIVWAGAGMVLATLATFLIPEIYESGSAGTNLLLIAIAIGISGGFAWVTGKKFAMTDMPHSQAHPQGAKRFNGRTHQVFGHQYISKVTDGKLVCVHKTSIEDTLYPDEVDYTTQPL